MKRMKHLPPQTYDPKVEMRAHMRPVKIFLVFSVLGPPLCGLLALVIGPALERQPVALPATPAKFVLYIAVCYLIGILPAFATSLALAKLDERIGECTTYMLVCVGVAVVFAVLGAVALRLTFDLHAEPVAAICAGLAALACAALTLPPRRPTSGA